MYVYVVHRQKNGELSEDLYACTDHSVASRRLSEHWFELKYKDYNYLLDDTYTEITEDDDYYRFCNDDADVDVTCWISKLDLHFSGS